MDFLKVKNGAVVDESGNRVRLRGTNSGAWMNMENFMNGFPGCEHRLRFFAKQILGEELGSYFFDSMLGNFFTEADVEYIASLGMNLLRIPLNYRHFEDDMHPFVYKEEGFQMLDKALDWCEKHNVYAILDLHAVQGWQNSDWHSDNYTRSALLWRTLHFQDRFVALWEEFAKRYKGRSVIAGYDLMNEPCTNTDYTRMPLLPYDGRWDEMNKLYRRVTEAIRKIDSDHIVILEGDDFSRRFMGLDVPFADNLMYSSHEYSLVGTHPELETDEQKRDFIRKEFLEAEGTKFAMKYNVPLWVSEFSFLPDQVELYEEMNVHWTQWSLKGVGGGFLLHTPDDGAYNSLVRPVMDKALFTSPHWGEEASRELREQIIALSETVKHLVGAKNLDNVEHPVYFNTTIGDNYVDCMLQYPYLELFQGKNKEELDHILSDFRFDRCQINKDVEERFRKYCKS